MTMPYERKNAVVRTEDFLIRLIDSKQTPRVPADIRREARALLKHYPTSYYMELAAEQAPKVFGLKRYPTIYDMEQAAKVFGGYDE